MRKKILFVLFIIIVYRIGSFIPTPGVDYNVVNKCMATIGSASQENFIGLVNLFSGGAMLQLSIFALGVMPYITASIVVQLLRVVIPRFEALHKEGQSGEAKLTQYTRYLTIGLAVLLLRVVIPRFEALHKEGQSGEAKLTQYTRYLTIGLAVLQSTTILVTARSGALFNYQCDQVIPDGSVFNLVVMVLIMTGGTGLIMWMAELVTDKGIGQGMSILIFMSICSGFLPQLWEIGYGTNGTDGDWLKFGIVVGVLVVILIFVDFVELCQRRVPVQYTRRMIGRKMYGGSSTYLPLKINMSGVIPPIFASSILAIPTLIAQFGKSDQSWVKWINANLANTTSVWYIALYALMIVFFCFFYTSITFNPDETADNMKQYGGFIPGIRAGNATSRYLTYVMNRLNTVGAVYLLFVALIPTVLIMALGLNAKLPFGGTTILIIAGVGLDTLRQAKAQTEQFQYTGFLFENVDHKEG
ncbi:preprotein translocase subunit SecY [Bifidobacterium longum]|nr:preprotein translocase subunit SecY [Bifidobacterium longum]